MREHAQPPGPRLPRPVQAALWGLRYPAFTQAAHRRFGPTFTVRVGTMPPSVVTTDREAVRHVLTGDPLARRNSAEVVRPLIGDGSIFLLDPAEHLSRRRLLLPPFHGERVRGYATLMQRLMDDAVAGLRAGEVVRVLPLAQNVAIEVILSAVLGVADRAERERFRTLFDRTLFYPFGAGGLRLGRALPGVAPPHQLREAAAFAASLPTPAVMTYFPALKTRSALNVGTWRWWALRDRLAAVLDEHVAATRADPRITERDDILAMLVRARDDDGAALTDDALREDVLTLVAAGHETTAAAIAWGAVLLAHDPVTRARAAAAAREDDERFMGALVKEVLRLRPPIPVAAARTFEEPLEIGPHTVPAGTPVILDAWGIHHDPALHPEPGRLRPERFLDGAGAPYTWLPFGGGAHRCIGAALAELEIRIALTTMLRHADLEPVDAQPPPVARRGLVLVPYGGARVRAAAHRVQPTYRATSASPSRSSA